MALRATLAAAALASALAAASPLPHLMYLLVDDWGHADVGYHRPGFNETVTPNIDGLVKVGVELNQGYVHKYCSPTRSSIQSGRLPFHVNVLNDDMAIWNKQDPISGFAGVPRNMTTMAMHLSKAGYSTHMAGKVRMHCAARRRSAHPLRAPPSRRTLTLLSRAAARAAPRACSGTRAWPPSTTRRTAAATTPASSTSTTPTCVPRARTAGTAATCTSALPPVPA